MESRALPADPSPPIAPPAAEELDPRAESFRTTSAIYSMLALLPMHVGGAYLAAPLPPGRLPKRTKK